MTQKVQLYKIRDFGSKINATIDYIRQNILSLIKLVLLIVAPFSLLFAMIFSISMGSVSESSADLSSLNSYSNISNFLSLILSALFVCAVYGFMKLNDSQHEPPSISEIFQKYIKKVPMLLVLILLVGIISVVGLVLFIIPGIYLFVTLSLALPIYLFEDENIGNAISKSFKLIKGKWWSTFGLLCTTSLIAIIVGMVFAIPFLGTFFSDIFSSGNDPQEVLNSLSNWYSVIGMVVMMIGMYLAYLIPLIALGFQYFNLSERVEGRGIRNQIDEFETVA